MKRDTLVVSGVDTHFDGTFLENQPLGGEELLHARFDLIELLPHSDISRV